MERDIEMSKLVEIGGFRYLITHPNPEVAWEIGIELTRLVGEPLSAMAQSAGDEKKAAEALPNAVRALLNKVDPKQSLALIKRVLSWVELQGEVGADNKKMLLNDTGFKIHFHGRSGGPIRVASEALAFTHADFFDAIADGIASVMKKAGDKMSAA